MAQGAFSPMFLCRIKPLTLLFHSILSSRTVASSTTCPTPTAFRTSAVSFTPLAFVPFSLVAHTSALSGLPFSPPLETRLRNMTAGTKDAREQMTEGLCHKVRFDSSLAYPLYALSEHPLNSRPSL